MFQMMFYPAVTLRAKTRPMLKSSVDNWKCAEKKRSGKMNNQAKNNDVVQH